MSVYDLMREAGDGRRSSAHTVYLGGDLSQMSAQRDFLRRQGFDVQQNNVYPCLRPEDEARALRLLFEHRVDGWWNYRRQLASFGIATGEEFDAVLSAFVEARRAAEAPQPPQPPPMLTRCFVLILQLPTGRFHPCCYREAPLPGNPDHLWRFKSAGHHTTGFETFDAAQACAREIAEKLQCPDRVVLDRAFVMEDPVSVLTLPPFGEGRMPFHDALAAAIL